MDDLIEIANAGPAIRSTNYWQTAHARRGYCYLSGNAGTLRLLVPPATEHALPEMRTAKHVTIRSSTQRLLDIVFDDGSDAPFVLTIDREMVDRLVRPVGRTVPFAVWTSAGLQIELLAEVRL